MTEASSRSRNIRICLCLALATVAVYWRVGQFEFANFDDPLYLTENRQIQSGLTVKALGWALTTPLDQWMPVTWVARILEWQLFGRNPGAQHLVNLLVHVVNTLLLFGVLNRMTGFPWRSALVAALFALHPLHVESVAWVTGLKDLLSMSFWLLTIWVYGRYTEQLSALSSQPSVRDPEPKAQGAQRNASRSTLHGYYALTLLCFALALMSKPMVVTLPFVLLLLDYWPLGRTRWARAATGESIVRTPGQLLTEKLPFFGLAAVSCVITFWAQHAALMVVPLEQLPLGGRIANVALAYMGYVSKTIWPTELAVFYPLDTTLSLAAAVIAGVGLVGVTVAVIWEARREPWLAMGWLWFLGTLVPVIGFVQVGNQSMADRYTYIPLVGLFVMLCWSVPRNVMDGRMLKAITCGVATAVLATCAVLTGIQVGYWKNSETLFRHALNVTRDNCLAHNNLGVALQGAGKTQEAITHFEQALAIRSDYVDAHSNLGGSLTRVGRVQEAIGHCRQALRIKPDSAVAHNNLGLALWQVGKLQEAIEHWEQALQINTDYVEAHGNLGNALFMTGKTQEAIQRYEQALRLKPDYVEVHYNLGSALEQAGRAPEAIAHYEQALQLNPNLVEARNKLARLRAGG